MRIAVLRPEPGNAATAARLTARGFAVMRLPLFAVAPVGWQSPGPGGYDALLITSANAVRHAGAQLAALAALPVIAVGGASADAARAASLTVAVTGTSDAGAAVGQARAAGFSRLLHLAGREHIGGLPGKDTIVVYASAPLPHAPGAIAALAGTLALVHSPRAAQRLAALVDDAAIDRATITLAAISPAAATAAGAGWRRIAAAPCPADDALIDLAAHLAETETSPQSTFG